MLLTSSRGRRRCDPSGVGDSGKARCKGKGRGRVIRGAAKVGRRKRCSMKSFCPSSSKANSTAMKAPKVSRSSLMVGIRNNGSNRCRFSAHDCNQDPPHADQSHEDARKTNSISNDSSHSPNRGFFRMIKIVHDATLFHVGEEVSVFFSWLPLVALCRNHFSKPITRYTMRPATRMYPHAAGGMGAPWNIQFMAGT